MTRFSPEARVPQAAWWIAAAAVGAGFLLHASHFAFLTDDAYISFRYAKNLVEGHGLVYNPGERVEGYTNFLWVMLSAGLFTLGVDPEKTVTVVSRAISFGLLGYLLWLGRLRHGRVDALCLVAVALLASNRTFAAWSTGGLATAAFTATAFAAVSEYGRAERPTLRHGFLFAIAALVRPEGVLFFALAGLDSLWRVVREPAAWMRRIGWAVGFLAIFVPYFVWRTLYYGYLLPNTFYAKVPDPTGYLSTGVHYVAVFATDYWGVPVALLAIGGLLTGRPVERRQIRLLLGSAMAYLAYVVWVGGDFMEFRFMMPALPTLYFCAQEGLRAAHVALVPRLGPRWANAVAAAVTVAILACTVRPTFDDRHPPELGWSIEQLATSTRIQDLNGRWLRDYAEPGESLATFGGGVGPYRSGLYTVEMRGLTDPAIAHAPLEGRGMVGHERQATSEYLAEKRITYALTLGSRTFSTEPLDDPSVVSVRRDEAVWLNFETFEPIDALRRRLLGRGALVVLPGPCTRPFDLAGGTPPGWRRAPGRTGSATSPAFRLRGRQLRLRIGGGHDPERLRVTLLVEGRHVQWATGPGSEAPRTELWHVAPFEGRRARLLLTDEATGPLGFLRLHDVALCAPSPGSR